MNRKTRRANKAKASKASIKMNKPKGGYTCNLFIKKTDSRDGSVEFCHAEVTIPAQPFMDRRELIGSLGDSWLHSDQPSLIVAAYLSHSPSLQMAANGMLGSGGMIMNMNGVQQIDLDNLGCVIEFTADAHGVGTTGPQWMSPDEVNSFAKATAAQYAKSHDIKYHIAA